MNQPVPISIRRLETEGGTIERGPIEGGPIEIVWSDGGRRTYSPRLLRDACPCANCREQRIRPAAASLLPVLSAEEVEPLSITGMKPVGQYAYSIEFSDGHSSGIYTLEYLRELGG